MPKRTKEDWTAEDLTRQADAAAALVQYLRDVDEDDQDLIEDTIEGETDFKEAIDRALEHIAEAEMMVAALKLRVDTMNARKKRFEDKAGFLRHCLEMALATANGDRDLPFSLMTPSATVTLKAANPKIIIEDEAKVPARFWKTPDPVIDKAALNAHVRDCLAAQRDDGDAVIEDDDGQREPFELPDGVSLAPPGFSLSIRRK